MIASQSYSRHRLVTVISMCCALVLLATPALGNKHPDQQRQTKRKLTKPKKCKRRKKAKKTRSCKRENAYNGLQETLVFPNATSLSNITRCLTALKLSGFDLRDFGNYSKWIDESSVMLVADTGVFVGTQGIKEYVKASNPQKDLGEQLVKEIIFNPEVPPKILPITADGNECKIMTSRKISFVTHQLSSPVDTIVGNRFTFTILDDDQFPSKLHMNRVDIYLPKGLFGFLFTPTYGRDFAKKICKNMRISCRPTFRKNCYKTVRKCISDMLSLPVHDEAGRIDGNSFACRVLHSFLAASNKKHCAHISIDPAYDSNCNIKCQKSKEINNEDIFHPIELVFLAQHAGELGLGEKQWEARPILFSY